MKLLLLLASFIAIVSAATHEELWMKFKQDHFKTYKSLREEKIRFEIFKSNVETIDSHNVKFENGEETWKMAINKFADLTEDEFEERYLSKMPPVAHQPNSTYASLPGVSIADSMDWRKKGAVLSVKDQGSCGGCWAFSACASIEGQNAIKHNITEDLSPQELIDCAGGRFQNLGCTGGWMDWAFAYIKYFGVSKLADYPFEGRDGTCQSHNNSGKIKLTTYVDLPIDEERIREAVATVGPISVALNALSFRFYAGGILNYPQCSTALNHGVLAVGYGTENGLDYWIVKNSWGANWGEDGYIRMVRNKNQCGIATKASYPVIE